MIVGEAFVAVRPDTKGFGPDAEKGILSSIGGVATKAGAIISKAFLGVGAAAVGAAGFGLKIAAANEQAEISFTTMLGSAQKAGKFLNDLKDFAAKTPFEFPELQRAASSLVSAGFEASQVIPIMRTLGDVTSGMGTGAEGVQRATVALQQMSAAGRITGEDLNQLRDAGIPVFDLLASATGKSKEEIAALAQAGKLGKTEMDQLFKALETGGGGLERFSGLMDKQSQSLTGLISTLKDTVGQSLATIAEPLVVGLKDALPAFNKTLEGIFTTVGPVLSATVAQLLNVFSELLPAVAPVVKVLGTFLADVLKQLGPVIAKAAPDLAKLAVAFGKLLEAVLPVLPALLDLAIKLIPPLTVLVTVLAKIIEAIPVPVLVAMVAAFIAFTQVVAPIIALAGAISAAGGAVAFLTATFPALAVVIGAITLPILGIVAAVAALAAIVFVVIKNWDTIAAFFTGVWETIKGVFAAGITWITENMGTIARVVIGVMTGGFSEVVLFIARHWDQIVSGVSDTISKIVGFFAGLPGRLLALVGAVAGAAAKMGSAILNGIADGIGKVAGFVGDFARGIGNGIIGFINRNIIDRVNNAIPNALQFGPIKVDLPDNPLPRIPSLAKGGIAKATPGGILANIAEAGRDEAVIPLMPGLLDGLKRIADGAAVGGTGLFRDVVFAGAVTADAAESNASALVRILKAEAWRQGK